MKTIEELYDKLGELRKQFPNNADYGREVANMLDAHKNAPIPCSLCDMNIDIEPKTKWKYGHNPAPLGKEGDRCCSTCNMMKVIPARLNQLFNPDKK